MLVAASWFKMVKWRFRYNYKKFPFYTIAALLIQNSWRHSYQQHYLNESSYMSSAIQYQTPGEPGCASSSSLDIDATTTATQF